MYKWEGNGGGIIGKPSIFKFFQPKKMSLSKMLEKTIIKGKNKWQTKLQERKGVFHILSENFRLFQIYSGPCLWLFEEFSWQFVASFPPKVQFISYTSQICNCTLCTAIIKNLFRSKLRQWRGLGMTSKQKKELYRLVSLHFSQWVSQ